MSDRERERERPVVLSYDEHLRKNQEEVKRQSSGKVVVWPHERPFRIGRQGKVRHYLYPGELTTTCTQDWNVFVHELPPGKPSGKHRHQGGLVIFVLEGHGKSWVEGKEYEWKPGDIMILPLRIGEVEHQHFNLDPDKPAYWIALINKSVLSQLASETKQIEISPLFKGKEVVVEDEVHA
jgi:mannose-6-phosphate isomerase-like protein (cupin superfamily)